MGTRGKFPSAIRLVNTALQYGEDSTSGKSEPNLGRLHGDLCAGNQANSVGLNHLRCKAMRQPGKGSKEDEVAAVNGTVTDLLIFIYDILLHSGCETEAGCQIRFQHGLKMAQQSPNMPPNGPAEARNRPKIQPQRNHASVGVEILGPKAASRTPNDPTKAQHSPKMAQQRPNIASKRPNISPKPTPKKPPTENVSVGGFFLRPESRQQSPK